MQFCGLFITVVALLAICAIKVEGDGAVSSASTKKSHFKKAGSAHTKSSKGLSLGKSSKGSSSKGLATKGKAVHTKKAPKPKTKKAPKSHAPKAPKQPHVHDSKSLKMSKH